MSRETESGAGAAAGPPTRGDFEARIAAIRKPPKGVKEPAAAKEARIAARRQIITAMKSAGYHVVPDIVEAMRRAGYPKEDVYADLRAIAAEWREEAKASGVSNLDLELRRYDIAQRSLWASVTRGDTDAIRTFLQISRGRAALLNLENPEVKNLAANVEWLLSCMEQAIVEELGSNSELGMRLLARFAKIAVPDHAFESSGNGPEALLEA